MRGFRAQQDDHRVHWDMVVCEEQRVVHHQVGMFPGRGAGLEVKLYDLLQRIAEAENYVGHGGDG